jgi:inosine/xanthosine triphosphatase
VIIGVGSDNPAKTGATRDAFVAAYGSHLIRVVRSLSVDSGVPHNPVGAIQCIQGARNRARAALECALNADFAVGIESGIVKASFGQANEGWFERTWAVVLRRDGTEGIGSGASFRVPEYAAQRICAQQEGLGAISDGYAGTKGIKTSAGYCGLVTKGTLCRREITRDAVIAALSVFLLPNFFSGAEVAIPPE